MDITDTAGATRDGSGTSRGLIAYFVQNPVAANLLMVFLIAAGTISGMNLAVQNLPDFDSRRISVTVPFPGASPYEVSEDINQRVEEALVGIAGVDRVVSKAQDGIGSLNIELLPYVDSEDVLDDVKSAVAALENFSPLGAERPEIEKFRLRNPVMTLAVSSTNATEHELRIAAEDLQERLLALPGVSQVNLSGTRDREISIGLSETALRQYRLDINEVARIIRSTSLNLTSGEVNTDAGDIALSFSSKRTTGDEFRDIPLITRFDGTVITLDDVAVIRDGFAADRVIAELNGAHAVFVQVDASDGQSQREIRKSVLEFLDGMTVDDNVTVSIWDDDFEVTRDRLTRILGNSVIGTMLVFLCLVTVFDLRSAFWISLGIPLSFVGSLMFFAPADLTLNMGTMLAFFLLVGIVVDDAVVVGESIIAERKKGVSGREAAITGARNVFGPLFIGALTTIIALVPLHFIDSGGWQVIRVFPYVAAFVLLVSLVEAFLILPSHLSHDRPWSAPPLSNIRDAVDGRLKVVRDRLVASTVAWSIRNTWLSILATALLVVVSVALLRFEAVPVVFGEGREGASDTIQVEIRLPTGSPFNATREIADRFRDAALEINDVFEGTPIRSVSVIVGSILSTSSSQDDTYQENVATVRANLAGQHQRNAQPREIERAWRNRVGSVLQAERVEFVTTLRKSRPNLAYSIRHDDRQVLQEAADSLKVAMAEIPGVYGIFDNSDPGKRKLEIELTDEGKIAGLSPATLGAQLRARLHGIEVQRIQRGRDELRVMVSYPSQNLRSLGELKHIRVDGPDGGTLPLSTVARITEVQELAELSRLDGKPVIFVEARADPVTITPNRARRLVEQEIIGGLQKQYPGIRIERDGSGRDEYRTLQILSTLAPLALLAIYAAMAGFLRSYWKPLIAAAGMPAAFVGAVLIHWILGWQFTFMSIFGILAVSGVVVNDGLVLLDRYNTIRKNQPALPAIAAAAKTTRQRFRAVFLTSLTTILGLSPLLYERSDSLQFMIPFAASMLGGLITAGLFVLFVLPAMIMVAEGHKE